MRKVVYNNQELMKDVISAKRYVDDGAGLFKGNSTTLIEWISSVNEGLSGYGLKIDESCICSRGSFIAFLDIQFCFDDPDDLQTDPCTPSQQTHAPT